MPHAPSTRSLDLPSKAAEITLAKGDTATDAFITIAWSCLDHLAHNEAVFLRTRDPEALHQLRVATRRLRSAFSLFRPVWRGDSEAARLKADLRRMALPFGRLRDLDVLLAGPFDEQAAAEPAVAAVRELLLAEQRQAGDAAVAVLESVAWRRLITAVTHWLQDGRWRRSGHKRHQSRSAKMQARAALDTYRRRVRSMGNGLAKRSAVERHRVRIEAKKLRYGTDFLGSLFPNRAREHDEMAQALEQLQEHLGHLNDIATARRYWTKTGLPEPASFAQEEQASLAAAVKDRKAILAVRPFWE